MIKVFKVKDLIKYLIKILIVLTAVALVVKVFNIGNSSNIGNNGDNIENFNNNTENNVNENNSNKDTNKSKAWIFCIDDMLPQIAINKAEEESKKTSQTKIAFSSELEIMEAIKSDSNEVTTNTAENEENK